MSTALSHKDYYLYGGWCDFKLHFYLYDPNADLSTLEKPPGDVYQHVFGSNGLKTIAFMEYYVSQTRSDRPYCVPQTFPHAYRTTSSNMRSFMHHTIFLLPIIINGIDQPQLCTVIIRGTFCPDSLVPFERDARARH